MSANLLLPLYIRFYVDALNFYYGIARPYGIKWIDLERLLIHLVREKIPNAEVEKIFIFTSMVKDFPPGTEQRQKIYLNALEASSSRIEIIRGKFSRSDRIEKDIEMSINTGKGKKLPMWVKGRVNIEKATIRRWGEKQTDVNLACRMVEDAYMEKKPFNISCLVSKDGDFLYPLVAKKRLEQRVLLIAPRAENRRDNTSADLLEHILPEDIISPISRELVESCQLPDEIDKIDKVTGKTEKYYIPKEWELPKSE